MPDHNYFSNLIWQIADLLRGPYRPPQYERVMLPMTVRRRFDGVLDGTKKKVLAEYEKRKGGKLEGDALDTHLNKAAGERFHNHSERSRVDAERVVIRPLLLVVMLLIVSCAAKPENTKLLGKWQYGIHWTIYVYRDKIASINGLKGKWTKVEADAIRLEYRESERSPERILRLAIVENHPGPILSPRGATALERLRNMGNGNSPCTYDSNRGKEVTCLDVNGQSLACDR